MGIGWSGRSGEPPLPPFRGGLARDGGPESLVDGPPVPGVPFPVCRRLRAIPYRVGNGPRKADPAHAARPAPLGCHLLWALSDDSLLRLADARLARAAGPRLWISLSGRGSGLPPVCGGGLPRPRARERYSPRGARTACQWGPQNGRGIPQGRQPPPVGRADPFLGHRPGVHTPLPVFRQGGTGFDRQEPRSFRDHPDHRRERVFPVSRTGSRPLGLPAHAPAGDPRGCGCPGLCGFLRAVPGPRRWAPTGSGWCSFPSA